MIVDTLNEMRIAALKSGDKQVENHASYFLSVAKKVIKDGGDEAKVIATFQKEVKALRETLGYARNEAEKTTLTSEIAFVSQFLPKMMSEDEIQNFISEMFTDIKSMNKKEVIPPVMKALRGKADGKMINTVIAKMMQ